MLLPEHYYCFNDTMALVVRNELILPVVQDKQLLGQVATYRESRNNTFHTLRSQLHVADNVVATFAVVDAVDASNVQNSTGRGVSVVDQRLGQARYAIGARQATIEGDAQPFAFTDSTPVKLVFARVTTPGLGITSLTGSTTTNITLPDTGIYSISTTITLGTQPLDPNSIAAYRVETRRSAAGIVDPPETEIVSSVLVSRNPGDGSAIHSSLNNNALSISVGASFVAVAVPDGDYPLASGLANALQQALAFVFPLGTWNVFIVGDITTIQTSGYVGWRLNTAFGQLANILGYTGGILVSTTVGSVDRLVGSLPVVVPDPVPLVITAENLQLFPKLLDGNQFFVQANPINTSSIGAVVHVLGYSVRIRMLAAV